MIKVGDYIRTKEFGIRKITFIDEIALECGEYSFETDKSIPEFCDFSGEDIIGKPSPNITDLIEVGDYVNGKKVLNVAIDYIFDYSEEIKIVYFDKDKKDYIYSKEDIKTIVTKEQFKSMEYEVR